jgi:hypothetical protein
MVVAGQYWICCCLARNIIDGGILNREILGLKLI